MSQVLAMLQEPGTLDELGIGQIRDAFSDLLFRGFLTIQTRAKFWDRITGRAPVCCHENYTVGEIRDWQQSSRHVNDLHQYQCKFDLPPEKFF